MANSGDLVLELVLRFSRFDPELQLQEHRALSTFLRNQIEINLAGMENAPGSAFRTMSYIYMPAAMYDAVKRCTQLTNLSWLEPQQHAIAAVSKRFAGKLERIRSLECTRITNLALSARLMYDSFETIALFGRTMRGSEPIIRHVVLTPTHKLLRNDDALQAKIRALEAPEQLEPPAKRRRLRGKQSA